jgi:hypothetical protein
MAQLRLTQAYQAVFQGSPMREDQELVLADLANACSWRRVCGPTVSNEELRFTEGARAAFSRVFAFLSLSPSDVKALEEAARREAATDENAT